jgi:tetratricopeptide (TPR) repeat protein
MEAVVASTKQVRDFLRHVDEPDRLCGNPLANAFIGRQLRLVAEKAISRLPCRARAILTRCDLGGELHRIVARDLGICERQFYRERSTALRLVAEALSRDDALLFAPAVALEPNLVRTSLGYAIALENAGRFEQAILHLERLSSDGIPADARARVECRIANLCCDGGDVDRAQRHLDVAKVTIDAAPLNAVDRAMLIIESEIARVKVEWLTGALAKSKAVAEGALRRLTAPDCIARREWHTETSATLLLLLAQLYCAIGEFSAGLSTALEARAILERGNMSHTRLFVESLVMVASIRVVTLGGLSAAILESTQAYELAQKFGLVRQCAVSANALAGIYLYKLDLERAVAFAREAMDVGRLVCSNEEFFTFSINFATIQLRRGDVGSAKRALMSTRARVVVAGTLHAELVHLSAAQAMLAENDFRQSLVTAQKVDRIMRAAGNSRFLGAALCVQAEAHSGLGNSKRALHAICESMELLVDHAHPFALSQTYASAARLTGKAAYARAARDLEQALSLS